MGICGDLVSLEKDCGTTLLVVDAGVVYTFTNGTIGKALSEQSGDYDTLVFAHGNSNNEQTLRHDIKSLASIAIQVARLLRWGVKVAFGRFPPLGHFALSFTLPTPMSDCAVQTNISVGCALLLSGKHRMSEIQCEDALRMVNAYAKDTILTTRVSSHEFRLQQRLLVLVARGLITTIDRCSDDTYAAFCANEEHIQHSIAHITMKHQQKAKWWEEPSNTLSSSMDAMMLIWGMEKEQCEKLITVVNLDLCCIGYDRALAFVVVSFEKLFHEASDKHGECTVQFRHTASDIVWGPARLFARRVLLFCTLLSYMRHEVSCWHPIGVLALTPLGVVNRNNAACVFHHISSAIALLFKKEGISLSFTGELGTDYSAVSFPPLLFAKQAMKFSKKNEALQACMDRKPGAVWALYQKYNRLERERSLPLKAKSMERISPHIGTKRKVGVPRISSTPNTRLRPVFAYLPVTRRRFKCD